MILKLDMKHQGLELYKIYINHDPGKTLTYFTVKVRSYMQSTVIQGENCRKWTNGHHIYDSENKIDPKGSSVSALGLYTYM